MHQGRHASPALTGKLKRVAVSCLCTDSINFRYHWQSLLLRNLSTYTANQPNLQCVSQTG
ncbi:hypothetical protein BN2497_7883 [Janthinobacterium sp. CG23_2]|nr:hypothetical protein BN2497_7883 [Janthinobacterium sp. CG23_2]CUU30339.1 hypothetical protein BN3177_7883 [Janthinobacterium sp. CG23_2]